MRVFVDNCVPFRFCKLIVVSGNEVVHSRDKGWQSMKNGLLVKEVSKEFAAMVTIDKNMQHQTSLAGLDLTVYVLDAVSNRLSVVSEFASALNLELETPRPGKYVLISVS